MNRISVDKCHALSFPRVFGEVDSKAAVHMEDGVMTAKIVTPEDIYHVEPSWRHFADGDGEDDKRSMIAYKESDVLYSWNHPNADDFIPPKVIRVIEGCAIMVSGRAINDTKSERLWNYDRNTG